jgi:hypothetical protein
MTLTFEAKFVDCGDAIEGEIIQVSFDTIPGTHAEEERRSPYLLLSRNFEFSDAATAEWHDGQNYDGGAEIASMTLRRNRVVVKLDRDLEFEVAFRVSDKKFRTLKSFLRRLMDDRVCTVD